MAKKSTKKLVVKKSAPTVTKKIEKKELSKMELATQFLEDHEGLTRSEAIEGFVTNCGLTKAGAGTYFQLLKVKLNYKPAKRAKKEKEAD